MGQIAEAYNNRPQRGLPSDTKPNPKQVKAVTTQSGLQLKEIKPKQVNHKDTDGEIPRYEESFKR